MGKPRKPVRVRRYTSADRFDPVKIGIIQPSDLPILLNCGCRVPDVQSVASHPEPCDQEQIPYGQPGL